MRHVLITSRVLTHPHGTVVSQERLGMTDEKLDEFIAGGYGIEFQMDEPSEPAPEPPLAAVVREAEAPEAITVTTEPVERKNADAKVADAPGGDDEEPAPRRPRSRRRDGGDGTSDD